MRPAAKGGSDQATLRPVVVRRTDVDLSMTVRSGVLRGGRYVSAVPRERTSASQLVCLAGRPGFVWRRTDRSHRFQAGAAAVTIHKGRRRQ